MPLGLVTPTPTPTRRPWVEVYESRPASPRTEDSPPSYVKAMGLAEIERPSSSAAPVQVANKASWFRRHFRTSPDPQALQLKLLKLQRKVARTAEQVTQAEELQAEHRARTQGKLEAARDNLRLLQIEHADCSHLLRSAGAGGLYDYEECSVVYLAQREVQHYEEKKQKLLKEHLARQS